MESLITSSTNIEKLWTESEVIALVDDLKVAKNKAIDEAVKQATAPLLAAIYVYEKTEPEKIDNVWLIIGGVSIAIISGLVGAGLSSLVN